MNFILKNVSIQKSKRFKSQKVKYLTLYLNFIFNLYFDQKNYVILSCKFKRQQI